MSVRNSLFQRHLAFVEQRACEERQRVVHTGTHWKWYEARTFARDFFPDSTTAHFFAAADADMQEPGMHMQALMEEEDYGLSPVEQNVRAEIREVVERIRRDPHSGHRAVVFDVDDNSIEGAGVRHPNTLPYVLGGATESL